MIFNRITHIKGPTQETAVSTYGYNKCISNSKAFAIVGIIRNTRNFKHMKKIQGVCILANQLLMF